MIAKEGRKIILILFFLTIFFRLVGNINGFEWLSFIYLISGLFFLFSLIFFRDPKRNIPAGENSLVSPADGKIINVEQVNDPDVGKGILVSVFLNIFNVHVNRVPVTVLIKKTDYKQGKFLAAFNHKASDENEQIIILMESPKGLMKVKQVAGLIARRIHCYAQAGKTLLKGDRLGFIMFGSRTDIIFPLIYQVQVHKGQKVTGGETIIAKLD
jgi:phosphatidylserine decarboxylase